jgi:hypothetical protein
LIDLFLLELVVILLGFGFLVAGAAARGLNRCDHTPEPRRETTGIVYSCDCGLVVKR